MSEDLQSLIVAAVFSGFFFVLHVARTYLKGKDDAVELESALSAVRYRQGNLSFLEGKYKKVSSTGKLGSIEFLPESTGKTRTAAQIKTAQDETVPPKLQKN